VATEKLNPNGWNNGWPGGFVTNVDEPIASADGSTVSTFIINDTVRFDLDTTVIDDNDTVTGIDITIRASFQELDGFSTGGLSVALFIGGSSQGAEATGNLSSSHSNVVLSNAGWDADWTTAQLNGAQVRVVATGSGTSIPIWQIDAIDVDITYTANVSMSREPAREVVSLVGKVPVVDIPGQEIVAKVALALAGQAPTLGLGVITARGSLATAGQVSYTNPVTAQLQIDGWDGGWPTGFAANVDEPVADADGSVVSTVIHGDIVTFDLDDVPVTLVDEDTVLKISALVRYKSEVILPSYTMYFSSLSVALLVDSVSRGATVINTGTHEVMTNYTVTNEAWNQDWTAEQLNSMQLRVQPQALIAYTGPPLPPEQEPEIINAGRYSLDTIDVYVEHSAQSPMLITPPVLDLVLSNDAPIARRLKYEVPLVGALVLAGQAPSLQREDDHLPSEARRFLVEKTPLAIVNHIVSPAVVALALAEQTPVREVDTGYAPAVRAEVLAGKAPTIITTAEHFSYPARLPLLLPGAAPLIGDDRFDPSRARQYLTGKVPTIDLTVNSRPVMSTGAAALTSYAAVVTSRNKVKEPLVGAVALSTAAPSAYVGSSIVVPSATTSLSLATFEPSASFQFAQMFLLGYAPTLVIDHLAKPAAGALVFDQFIVEVENGSIFMYVGSLQLAGHAPALDFSSFLTTVDPRLISLTVDRSIEFIATPTDILIE